VPTIDHETRMLPFGECQQSRAWRHDGTAGVEQYLETEVVAVPSACAA